MRFFFFTTWCNSTNTSWFCPTINKRGKILEEIISNNNLVIANPDTPTSKKSFNIIDMVICTTDVFGRLSNISVCKSLDSYDHWPIRLNCNFEFKAKEYKKIDWEIVDQNWKEKFSELINIEINSTTEMESMIAKLNEIILGCIEANTKIKKNTNYKIRLPKNILKLIKTKKQLQREFSKSHDPQIKTPLNNISH